METQELLWLSVEITPENIEELEKYTEYRLNSYVFLSYHIGTNTFEGSYNLVPSQEEFIPDFSKLPEIRLLISLGMTNRDAFNKIYGDYVCQNLNG